MQLDSVRTLKAELLALSTPLAEAVASTRSFSAFADRREVADRTMSRIALGIAPRRRGYSLAVRPQQSGPLVQAMVQTIREEARGEVDVQFIGSVVKFAGVTQPAYYQQRRRPLRIGSSISDVHSAFDSAGTLGCFVSRRQAPHYLGLLTNNHVIAGENATSLGSAIVQPGTLDGGAAADLIGELGKVVRLRKSGINHVDAAVADLHEGIEFNSVAIGNLGDLSGLGDVTSLPGNAAVYKVGRTTGQRKGRITAFDVDNVLVEYDMGDLRFDMQIEIEGTGNRSFSDSGDSGSLIVDEDLRAIGLLFAGGDEGGGNGKGLTYANPIGVVLDSLQVDLER